MIFEVCVDSVEGVLAAQQAGAQRVELCDNLVEGGTTPSLGVVRVARRRAALAVYVIVRPRGGDFVYTEAEFEAMQQDILALKQEGVDGVVLGLLRSDGSVDVERTQALVELARPLRVTFHRAFDLSREAGEALEAVCSLGIERVLTSGQAATALEGAACIAGLVRQAGERVIILAGGGITAGNAAAVVAATGVRELHFAARKTVGSTMTFRRPGVSMGKVYQPDEYTRRVTDVEGIAALISAVRKA